MKTILRVGVFSTIFVIFLGVLVIWLIGDPPIKCVVESDKFANGPIMGGTDNADFSWSPDGQYLAFRGPSKVIYLLDMTDSEALLQKFHAYIGRTITWSPHEQRFLFISSLDNQDGIYIADLNNDSVSLLNEGNTSADLVWSPHGDQVVFSRNHEGLGYIFLLDVDSSTKPDPILLLEDAAWHPTWSPDNTKLAFISMKEGNDDIYIFDINMKSMTQLTDNEACERRSAWNPIEEEIAFLSNNTGNWDLFTIDKTGKHIQNLTNSKYDEIQFSWSPDGEKIAYVSFEPLNHDDFRQEIHMISKDGSQHIQFTDTKNEHESFPQWSPDGKKIAFLSFGHGQWHIDIVDIESGDRTRLTTIP